MINFFLRLSRFFNVCSVSLTLCCGLQMKLMSSPSTKNFFVLGSGSFTRKNILTNSGYSYFIIKADIDESAIGDRNNASSASRLVVQLANAKADAILPNIPPQYRNEILLTADQVVVHNNKILEKPIDRLEAERFIKAYGSSSCSTVGSIVLTDICSGKRVSGVDTATIYFDDIPTTVINTLLDEGTVLNCAGGLMVEHPLILPYRKILHGTEESLMGLSVDLLRRLVNDFQLELSDS